MVSGCKALKTGGGPGGGPFGATWSRHASIGDFIFKRHVLKKANFLSSSNYYQSPKKYWSFDEYNGGHPIHYFFWARNASNNDLGFNRLALESKSFLYAANFALDCTYLILNKRLTKINIEVQLAAKPTSNVLNHPTSRSALTQLSSGEMLSPSFQPDSLNHG